MGARWGEGQMLLCAIPIERFAGYIIQPWDVWPTPVAFRSFVLLAVGGNALFIRAEHNQLRIGKR